MIQRELTGNSNKHPWNRFKTIKNIYKSWIGECLACHDVYYAFPQDLFISLPFHAPFHFHHPLVLGTLPCTSAPAKLPRRRYKPWCFQRGWGPNPKEFVGDAINMITLRKTNFQKLEKCSDTFFVSNVVPISNNVDNIPASYLSLPRGYFMLSTPGAEIGLLTAPSAGDLKSLCATQRKAE